MGTNKCYTLTLSLNEVIQSLLSRDTLLQFNTLRIHMKSRTVRPLCSAGLLPDYPNDPQSRAAPGLSGYSPKSGFPSL